MILLTAIGRDALALGLLVSAGMAAGMVATVAAATTGVILLRQALLHLVERHPVAARRLATGLRLIGALSLSALGLLLLLQELA